MIKTPLYSKHLALGAKMVNFADFLMPIQYSGIIHEHRTVREKAGLFDVSHMGEFIISGPASENFLDRVTINNIKNLHVWQAQYSAMCNEDGGIIDDLIIYRYPEHFMVVVNAANIKKDFHWLAAHKIPGVKLSDESSNYGLIALQGPLSRAILTKVLDASLDELEFYWFKTVDIQGVQVTLARTGYTGELGFELYTSPDHVGTVWDRIMEIGLEVDILPVGLGCRDTLRLEMKYCLYGNDIDETTNPIEAGLGWITKLDKRDFIGRAAILKARENLKRRLVCLEMLDRAIPRKGYRIFHNDSEVGFVTSGSQSPSLNKGIALGYVAKEFAKRDTELSIDIRGKNYHSIVVSPPFYRNGTAHT